ncbi:hypothetical protein EVAR_47720_1 [Eumeta japonica]|uniref:Uncharacterized protein n=1 Tax=Eumeta variegata TaxID=151549 RepID=A0A4C1VX57_EUMVA|nr:hypothetical protein EVAR_47720_1 [Eumeta japonica]
MCFMNKVIYALRASLPEHDSYLILHRDAPYRRPSAFDNRIVLLGGGNREDTDENISDGIHPSGRSLTEVFRELQLIAPFESSLTLKFKSFQNPYHLGASPMAYTRIVLKLHIQSSYYNEVSYFTYNNEIQTKPASQNPFFRCSRVNVGSGRSSAFRLHSGPINYKEIETADNLKRVSAAAAVSRSNAIKILLQSALGELSVDYPNDRLSELARVTLQCLRYGVHALSTCLLYSYRRVSPHLGLFLFTSARFRFSGFLAVWRRLNDGQRFLSD